MCYVLYLEEHPGRPCRCKGASDAIRMDRGALDLNVRGVVQAREKEDEGKLGKAKSQRRKTRPRVMSHRLS